MLKAVIFRLDGVLLPEGVIHPKSSNMAIPFAIDLLQDLRIHGIKLAVISPYDLDETVDILRTLGTTGIIDVIIPWTVTDGRIQLSDIYSEAITHLMVKASECIAIDDTFEGIEAASSMGIVSIGYQNPSTARKNLWNASYLIEGFDEIDYAFISRVYQYAHGEPATILTTERLIIRELTEQDIWDLFLICQNPDVRKFAPAMDDIELEIELHRAYIRNVYQIYGYGLWGVFLKENSRLIGRCGIEQRMVDNVEEFEVGYLLDRNYWGFGYAREALEAVIRYARDTLGIERLLAVIDKENVHSIRLAKRTGFEKTGETMRNGHSFLKYYKHLSENV